MSAEKKIEHGEDNLKEGGTTLMEGVKEKFHDFTAAVTNQYHAMTDKTAEKTEDTKDAFWDKYKKVEDFGADTKEDLLKKVDDTKTYLSHQKEEKQEALTHATEETKKASQDAYDKVYGWYNEVSDFETRLAHDTEETFSKTKEEWGNKIAEYWNQGMDKLGDASKAMKTAATG